ncbi:MAG TPA: Ppx/GppA phosphatase family protein [Methylibium sp.]|uniref:Ppx/GppA phosphatase family protein n=1 Tax=Methylibium sp. TaxID=2067992 RepID=UPI002DB5F03A|nr:Ppx/GppA phosphatase family protein [Methylibium sp.]HEU4458578.1 Ppx/GppA phosphatase family protein [Methylibium sp.]
MPSADTAPTPLADGASSGLLAAIDIGSNSFRLEIGQLQRGRYKRIDYLKETVRLGAGLDDEGRLSEEAQLRGLACLARFAIRLRGFAAWQVRAVATQTLREAKNRDAFLARARTVLGQPIEVISGREEARLIFAGVARLQPSERPRIVIDIGGRSTEMILGQGRTPRSAESFQVGSVSLSMRYFADGRYTDSAFRAAQIAAGAELEEALAPFAPGQWIEALGASGTVGAVSQLLLANGVTDGVITPAGLRWCIETCLLAGDEDALVGLPGLKPERRAVLGGGLSILYTLAMQFGIDALQPARGALRQGVIFDLSERHEAASVPADAPRRLRLDMRDASVQELQRRFGSDLAQAARVGRLALKMFRSGGLERAPSEAPRELGWAASLHEIGMSVSHHDHHRHSAYLISHVDAPGFSQSQQRRVAELVLGHRGSLRKLDATLANDATLWPVLCLRLAALLCHARHDVPERVVTLRRTPQGATLKLAPDWAAGHPRTMHLLAEEQRLWERSGRLGLAVTST